MTDIDRGAYAPQHDGPSMSFDPRRTRARQPAPFTLIFSGVVLAALIVAVFMFYRGGVRQAGQAPATVGAPVVAMKGPATVDTATPAATEDQLDVYVERQDVAAAPAFTAPPEQPQPRPAPRPAPVVTAAAPAVTTPSPKPVQTAAATPAPTTTRPSVTEPKPTQVAAASRPAPAPAAAPKPVQTAAATTSEPTPAAKPVVTAAATPSATTPAPWGALPPARANGSATTTAAATPTPAPTVLAAATKPATTVTTPAAKPVPTTTAAAKPAADGKRYAVQIGAFSSASIADAEYAKVSGVVGGRGKVVTPVQKDGSTFYRTVVTGFGSKAEADATCAKLKAAGKACFVKAG